MTKEQYIAFANEFSDDGPMFRLANRASMALFGESLDDENISFEFYVSGILVSEHQAEDDYRSVDALGLIPIDLIFDEASIAKLESKKIAKRKAEIAENDARILENERKAYEALKAKFEQESPNAAP